ncbi:MAG: Dps family protein [Dokdonella sp.]|uniref:Dps family protein n=1 Tax=Dokdonella sp. TaxID=2291710 RepID=UPI003F81D89B
MAAIERFDLPPARGRASLGFPHRSTAMAIDIGIAKKDRESIAKNLSRLLADTYSLYLKTHSFHWNVTGTMFNTLHLMFETQYNALWTAADAIAERIRALDVYAPGSYTQFGKLTAIGEETGVPDWKAMVQQLVEGHETVARTARDVFRVADKADDQPTADLATQRMNEHEKTAWMLRSLLK